jgi:hypothetical protein
MDFISEKDAATLWVFPKNELRFYVPKAEFQMHERF